MGIKKIISNTNLPNTIESLKKDLFHLGVEPEMVLLVHTSLSKIGWINGGAVTLILALQEVLTKEGTLIMPSHSADLSDPKDWTQPAVPEDWWEIIKETMPPFDQTHTPTYEIGVVPEVFRNFRSVVRSYHPTCSFSAWGKKAEKIIEKHSLDHGFGDKSPLNKIFSLNGHILLIGVTHESNTSLHLAEEKCRHYPQEKKGSPIYNEKGEREWKNYKQACYSTEFFNTIGNEFEKKHIFKRGKIGNADSKLINQRELVNFAHQWYDEKINNR